MAYMSDKGVCTAARQAERKSFISFLNFRETIPIFNPHLAIYHNNALRKI